MAVKLDKPQRPINQVLAQFASELRQALQGNLQTQKIWPTEVYPGYAQLNAWRRDHHKWHSTGEGATSFTTEVHSGTGNETIILRYNDYLRYVDMGVGQGTKWEDVEAERKARFNKRYISVWERDGGDSHRPAIMMEMRHLEGRMARYFEDFYGREVVTTIYNSIEGLLPAELYL